MGSNYIEANQALSKKDFVMRIKICRKEAKESSYWLEIIMANNNQKFSHEAKILIQESIELKKIFCSILEKSR